jgi:hypothetical protein
MTSINPLLSIFPSLQYDYLSLRQICCRDTKLVNDIWIVAGQIADNNVRITQVFPNRLVYAAWGNNFVHSNSVAYQAKSGSNSLDTRANQPEECFIGRAANWR